MRRSLLIVLLALAMVSTTVAESYAQRLIKKLYDDKETVRGSTGVRVIKKVDPGEREHEYYYGDKSSRFASSGTCYLQFYRAPEKATIVLNSKVTADVILAGLDRENLYFSEDFYWELYDKFIFRKVRLRYRKVGERKSDGMHKVVLYAGKLNINKWILKYCTVRYLPVAKGNKPRWHSHPNARKRAILEVTSRGWQARKKAPEVYPVWLHKDGTQWDNQKYIDAEKHMKTFNRIK